MINVMKIADMSIIFALLEETACINLIIDTEYRFMILINPAACSLIQQMNGLNLLNESLRIFVKQCMPRCFLQTQVIWRILYG